MTKIYIYFVSAIREEYILSGDPRTKYALKIKDIFRPSLARSKNKIKSREGPSY